MSDEQTSTPQPAQEAPATGGWALWNAIKQQTTKLESTVGSYLSEAPDNVQIRAKLGEWSSQAGKYLDAADERIGQIESDAQSYLKTLGGDIKSFIEHQGTPEPGQTAQDLFTAEAAPTSRLDQQLKELSTNASLYKDASDDTEPTIDVEAADTPELAKLRDALVPSQLTANQFWNKYAELKAAILDQDEKRKKILSQAPEEEDEGWGSSDEDK